MGYLFLLCLLLFSFNSINANGKLIVSLTFDDGYYSHMNASMVLDSLGMLGTFYVNSGRFNINRMGKGALLDIQSRHHEIAGHTVDHANLLALTTEERRFQICADYQTLIDDGFNITNFAYPFGADFPGAPYMLYNCGYQSARDSGGIKLVDACQKCLPALLLPVPDNQLYRLSSIVITSNMTLPELLSYLNAAAYFTQYDERWLIFTFHDIIVGTQDDLTSVKQITYDNFLVLLDALNGLIVGGIVEVLPVRSVMERYRSSYVPLQTDVPAPPATTNQPLPPATTAPATSNIIAPYLLGLIGLITCFV
jgi:peptidoglycan/xylan/chitin deacetylase (PgdA/CDA1 family)